MMCSSDMLAQSPSPAGALSEDTYMPTHEGDEEEEEAHRADMDPVDDD